MPQYTDRILRERKTAHNENVNIRTRMEQIVKRISSLRDKCWQNLTSEEETLLKELQGKLEHLRVKRMAE